MEWHRDLVLALPSGNVKIQLLHPSVPPALCKPLLPAGRR